jgi:hypothetical protein
MDPSPPPSRTAPPNLPAFALPTASFLKWQAVMGLGVGLIWAVITWLTSGLHAAIGPALAGGCASLAGWAGVLIIMPWKPRSMMIWPMLVMVGTGLVMIFTLAAGFVLHFAAHRGTISVWLCLVVSFWAVLAATVRVFAGVAKGTAGADPSSAIENTES